jgi:hypothetical protein
MSRKNSQETMPESVVAQVLSLGEMPINDLRALWRESFNSEPPTDKRRYLERRLGHRLQEIVFQKTNPTLLNSNQKRIDRLIDTLVQASGRKKAKAPELEPGTTLIREYREVKHVVTVMLDGDFEYEGCRYKSLSKIARVITGTRWSGPLFFGLTNTTTKSKTGGRK